MIKLAGLDLATFVAKQNAAYPPPPPREAATRGRPRKKAQATAADLADHEWKIECARRYVSKKPGSVDGSNGHGAAWDVAVSLVHGFALTVEEARPLFEEWNTTCQPPWNDYEIDHKLTDAAAKGGDGEPGHLIPARVRPAVVKYVPKPGTNGTPHANGEAAGAAGAGAEDDPKEGWPAPENPLTFPIPDNEKPPLANFEFEDPADEKSLKIPRLTEKLDLIRSTLFGPWPKRVGDQLFVQDYKYKPVFIKSHENLFGWFNRRAWVRWSGEQDFVGRADYYEYMMMSSEKYDYLELLPHWPPMPGTYYMHPPVNPPAPTGALDALVDHFTPFESVDREFIKAMICTLFWGGPPGKRPAFLITSGDDKGHGRGVGKSTLASILTDELIGGCIEVLPTEDIGAVKTRLFSDKGSHHRAARLDNIKTFRFSWADLEGLITASIISGKKLYVGEGRCPNLITWIMTLNGASLSKDMALRTVVIMLSRPIYDPEWELRVRQFIRDNLLAILTDIAFILMSPPPSWFTVASRWPEWEFGVLSKMADPEACQAAFLERQVTIDADDDDTQEARSFIYNKVKESHNGDPESSCIYISSTTMAKWISEFTGSVCAINRVTVNIKNWGIGELEPFRTSFRRGWIWRGSECLPGLKPRDGQIL